MPTSNRLLANGLRLITEPIAATKAAAIGFWFSGGSRDEQPDEHGFAHFTEHLLFKGTEEKSARELAVFFDRIGGYVNAFTERELVCLHCVVPANHASASLDVLLDMVLHSRFSDEDVAKERGVIVSEILAAADDPEEAGSDAALALMYPGSGFARPVAGNGQEVEAAKPAEVRSFYRNRFINSLSLVTVAGNVDPEEIERQLDAISYVFEPGAVLLEPAPPVLLPGRFFPKSGFSQSQIFLSYPVPRPGTEAEWFSWSIINVILGETVSSRLFQSLRENRGLCYSVYSFFACNRDSAIWSASTATPPEHTRETVQVLLEEIDKALQNGFTEREIADAKSHIAGEMLLSGEDIENRMKRLARQHFYNGEINSIEDGISILESVPDGVPAEIFRQTCTGTASSLVVYAENRQLKECKKIWR